MRVVHKLSIRTCPKKERYGIPRGRHFDVLSHKLEFRCNKTTNDLYRNLEKFFTTSLYHKSHKQKQDNNMKQSSINKARRIVLAWALVLAFISSPFADAFRSSATAGPPDVAPLDLPTKQVRILPKTQPEESTKTGVISKPTTAPRKVTYDLGLGKNKPVTKKRAEKTNPTDISQHPAQFMIQHDAVSDYPSPLDMISKSNVPSKPKRKNLPKVNHRRHSEDVLHIRDSHDQNNNKNDGNSRHPIIAPITTLPGTVATKFDVNTVWVEMMLHNERNKMLAQSS